MRRVWRWAAVVAVMLFPIATLADQGVLTVSPPVIQANLSQSAASRDIDVKVTNQTTAPVYLHVSVVDFGTLDETGGLFLIGQPNDFERKYGLAAWATLEKNFLSLAPGESETVRVTIDNKSSLSPGGHYGAVLFHQEPTVQSAQQATPDVNLKAVLTTLMFVRKDGGVIEDLQLSHFDRPGGGLSLPSQLNLRFQNAGNVHLVPRGLITVTDPAGKEISRGAINENSSIVLPESFRQLGVPLISEHLALLTGHYHVTLQYRYDGKDDFTTVQYDFWYAGALGIVLAPLLLLGLMAGGWLLVRYRRRRTPAH